MLDRCGDGFLDPGEECDGNELGVFACEELGFYQQLSALSCRKDCTIDVSACHGRCGDRVIQLMFGEQCDGENPALTTNFCRARGYYGGVQGCSSACVLDEELCLGNGSCGDGTWQQAHESCDGEELGGQTCESLGYSGGILACGNGCRFNVAGCIGGENCGNGNIDGPELCDGENLNGLTCADMEGFAGGTLRCGPDCRFDTDLCHPEAICGDGLVFGDEQCDGTNLLGQTCQNLGYASGALFCGADCRFDTRECTGSTGVCGNGILEAGETCDDGNRSDWDGCNGQCRVENGYVCDGVPSICQTVCGDRVIAGNEMCDGTTLGGMSCILLGHFGGNLACNSDCTGFNESSCWGSLNHYSPYIGTLLYVPAGMFQRDTTPTNLGVVSAFRMSQHEITRAQWMDVTGWPDISNESASTGTNDPVQQASWYHAIAFCNKLSIAEGLTPVYTIPGVDFATLTFENIPTISDSLWDAATANWSANGYRLPTAMEWMWAAMGADTGNPGEVNTTGYAKAFAGSTGFNEIGDYAVFGYGSGDASATTWIQSNPVGSKLANELGFQDLSGNVQEWMWDWMDVYPAGTLTDYTEVPELKM